MFRDVQMNIFVRCVLLCTFAVNSFCVYIENNGYREIVVSFSPSVKQEDVNFRRLKSILSSSSNYLFNALRKRAYFSEFVVALPPSWSSGQCESSDTILSSPPEVSVHIHDGSDDIRAQHSSFCGEQGDIIYLPLSWLNEENGDTFRHARQFVQHWATYRYGVFEETAMLEDDCSSADGTTWSPTGCYNLNFTSKMNLDKNGLPKCSFIKDFLSHLELTSSIMFNTESQYITHFCDRSVNYPHNAVTSTRHNILCSGKSVWKVIEDSKDFKYGKNLPDKVDSGPIKISFKCFREEIPSLFLTIQNSSTTDITKVVNEIRYSLVRSLLYGFHSDTAVTISTFSGKMDTESTTAFHLNLSQKEEAKGLLQRYIRVRHKAENVCPLCGLKKMIEIVRTSGKQNGKVVLIVLVSDMVEASHFEFSEELAKLKMQKFYLIGIQNTDNAAISNEMVDVILKAGGEIFIVPSSPVLLNTNLNMAFTNIYGNPLHTKDETVIVHQKTYLNVKSDFVDLFAVNGSLEGQLIYTMKCNNFDSLDLPDLCSDVEHLKGEPNLCGLATDLKKKDVSRKLQFDFKYWGSVQNLTCSSVATIRLKKGQVDKLTIRGWLNHHTVSPGKDALILYAEILHDFMSLRKVVVEAHIFYVTAEMSSPVVLELRDNGNGDPDTKTGDGIYSRYFSEFQNKGMFSVIIQAKVVRDTRAGNSLETQDERINTEFTRYKFIGSFFVVKDPSKMDVYPPNRIADLKVIVIDHENSYVSLQWTAPGDDYDSGKASHYEVKYAKNWSSLTDAGFDLTTDILETADNSKIEPLESGDAENHAFSVPMSGQDELYFIAVRAIDNDMLYSRVSNIAQFFITSYNQSRTTTKLPSEGTTYKQNFSTTFSNTITNETPNQSTGSTMDDNTINTTSISIALTTPLNQKECIDKKNYIIMIAASIGGGGFLLIIIVNIIICFCCFRNNGPMRFSKRNSMLPPHNIDISYSQQSADQRPTSMIESSFCELTNESADSQIEDHGHFKGYSAKQNVRGSYRHVERSPPRIHPDYADYRENHRLVSPYSALNNKPQTPNMDSELRQYSTVKIWPSHEREKANEDAKVYPLGYV